MKILIGVSVIAQIFEHLKTLKISIFEVPEKPKYGFIFTNGTNESLFALAPFTNNVRCATDAIEEVLFIIQQTTHKIDGSEILNSDLITSISRELRQHRVAKIDALI